MNLRDSVSRLLNQFWEDVDNSSLADRHLALRLERILDERDEPLMIPPPGFVKEEENFDLRSMLENFAIHQEG